MNIEDKFEYWKTYAERDIDAAEAMFITGRWFYVVFMCQQAIEKLVKGIYIIYVDDNVPKVHNIGLLINRYESLLPVPVGEELYLLFETLTKHYIADRYPNYISEASLQITKAYADKLLKETKEAFAWLLTLKPQNN
jgi:HEPN domain-containing protein